MPTPLPHIQEKDRMTATTNQCCQNKVWNQLLGPRIVACTVLCRSHEETLTEVIWTRIQIPSEMKDSVTTLSDAEKRGFSEFVLGRQIPCGDGGG
jgi:hypothetical protein